MTRRVGILGGTFDPVHLGHIDVASAGVRALHLSSLVMMPANVPPHRPSPSASPFHRFAMVSLAIADRHGWTASDMELLDPARSFTSATLDRLHVQGYAASELYFLIGVDAFRDIASWKDYPALLDKANFGVVGRPGFSVATLAGALPDLASRMRTPDHVPGGQTMIVLIDAATTDVSATAIRLRVAAGQSIDGLVPASVAQHIERHGLYTASVSDRRSGDSH
ncbi:MAG: nicotinate-nucleotide adenylyltransferase [Vicinamibacterales bacterium]